MRLEPLPIDPYVGEVVRLVREHGAAVVVAPPGAGKTTRIPPALAEDGPTIVLQPRRVAARALARRIASERGIALGEEIGWHVRFDRRASKRTRLLIATEGILTATIQRDPLLSEFGTVVLDEFHERSLHADLALALVRQAALAREDLRVVVMSATLDPAPVAAFLGGCPVLEVPGRPFPVAIEHAPGASPAEAIRAAIERETGHVLCFLPGAGAIAEVGREVGRFVRDGPVFPLHGSLGADAQDAALAPSSRPKVILATNIAETSLTVDGVTEVVDLGLQKVLRADDALGIDRLETERVSRDAADQRAGRAGRTAPGRAVRLWDAREDLRPAREPELARVDLAGPALSILAWGADPRRFAWFDPPPRERLDAALALLERLGAARAGRITDLGNRLARFPLHPRLAAVLVAAGGGMEAAAACAVLSEGWRGDRAADTAVTTDSDLLSLADRIAAAPRSVRRAAEQIAKIAEEALAGSGVEPRAEPRAEPRERHDRLLRAVLAGYPDRVGRRRGAGSPRLLLANGHGALVGRESGVRDGDFVVAVDLLAGARGPGAEALVRVASRVDRDWLRADRVSVVHLFDEDAGRVRAVERSMVGEIALSERVVPPDPSEAARILAEVWIARGLGEEGERLRRRLAFAGLALDLEELARASCTGRTSLPAIAPRDLLPPRIARDLDRLAPETLSVPSGRSHRLDYREDGSVVCAVKLQELFGLAASPRLGPRGEPVVFELLAPNGRPVQTTRDLSGFWDRTYPDVRKELRGRYPKHPWPEDPWSAPPTHRTRRPRG